MDVLRVRIGSHPNALVVPLVVGDDRDGVQVGEELTVSYWNVKKITAVSQS